MLIHREPWKYSGRTPEFFTGQAGCYCCPVSVGVYVCFYGIQAGATNVRDTDKYEVDAWTAKTDAPTPKRGDLGGASIEGVAYLYAGISDVSPFFQKDVYSYVQSSDTFTSKSDMTAHRSRMASTPIDGKAYSFCGLDSAFAKTRTSYQYTPGTDTWATKTDSPTPGRQFARGFPINTDGFVVGGDDTGLLKDNDRYTPSSDSWTAKADLDTSGVDARTQHGAFAIDGKGYTVFGNLFFGTFTNETAEYDAGLDTWASIATTVTTARYWVASASLGGSAPGYASGGLAAAASRLHDEFTPTSWTNRTDMPTPARYGHLALESV